MKNTQHKYAEHRHDNHFDQFAATTNKLADAAQRPSAPIPVKIRGVNVAEDAGYILDSWCASYSRSPVVGPIHPDVFKVEQRARLLRLLPRTKLLVACDPTQENTIRGWACYEPGGRDKHGQPQLPVLHYVYVRNELRGRGIATSLVDLVKASSIKDGPFWYTHWTHAMKKIETRWGCMFNPYILEVEK